MNKLLDTTFILILVWVLYYELTKSRKTKRPIYPVNRRLRRMLAIRKVSTLCARHLVHKSGKMSIVDASNCIKCKGEKK